MAIEAMLVEARRRASLSQRALAVRAGIPQASVSRIESGHISPRASTIERWLEACAMSLAITPLPGSGIDRSAIRERLAMTPLERSQLSVQEAHAMQALSRGRLQRTAR